VSVLAVLENLSQLAVGLANGAVVLYRGDIARDRFAKPRIVHRGNDPITGTHYAGQRGVENLYLSVFVGVWLVGGRVRVWVCVVHVLTVGGAVRRVARPGFSGAGQGRASVCGHTGLLRRVPDVHPCWQGDAGTAAATAVQASVGDKR
jgi:hypothetical protein